jgi:hypothetical protein
LLKFLIGFKTFEKSITTISSKSFKALIAANEVDTLIKRLNSVWFISKCSWELLEKKQKTQKQKKQKHTNAKTTNQTKKCFFFSNM